MMEDESLTNLKGSSLERTDSKEMKEMASDKEPKEIGQMIEKMSEYEIVNNYTEPVSGRHGNIRKKKIKDVEKQKRLNLKTGRRPPLKRTRSVLTDGFVQLMSPSSLETEYRSLDSDAPEIDFIQRIYAREGFGTCIHSRGNSSRTNEQQSLDDDNDGDMLIDGRSSSFSTSNDGFIPIESVIARDMSTTRALELCSKYVLRPYNCFLKVIGWRPFHSTHLDNISWFKKIASFIYPCFIFFMLLLTSAAQILICFFRSQLEIPIDIHCKDNDTNGTWEKITECKMITCTNDIFTTIVFGDILILAAYLWGLYIFRYSDPEHLSALIETVFLSFNTCLVRRSQKKLVILLLCFLSLGGLWILFSLLLSVIRTFILNRFSNTTIIWSFKDLDNGDNSSRNHQYIAAVATTVYALVGFVFFDLLYIAVMINYISQCQLLYYYVINVTEKIRHKAYGLGDAIKELYRVHEFLQVLNGKVAHITSLVFFLFVQGTVTSYIAFMKSKNLTHASIILGNLIQWLLATMIPLILAARLTAACKELKKVALEVGARPFVYSDTPQLVLDSFLLYSLSTNFRAKLGSIAIHTEYIFIIVFAIAMLFTIDSKYTIFSFAKWF